ncbi:threonine/serine dehydratase [Caulobacter sp. NIBR1757]|uniref:threonine ammonia-lyase n=1 Tax=Caulobacter sp. NIBR1757 TaxID=3016000 RepID=UPI0022F0924C|nr:threonine/serine dehydratase [Caulobacter sp. NIBR1757]WGM37685.1 L-threo-3-hydroxyaspartate ammonia-lyase [Caulobacter sp. NIBR1757]
MTVTFADIEAAARALEGLAVATPLIESPHLNAHLGGRVLLKPETLQRGGAFKFRGAMNKLSKLGDEQRARGVVACSSGNHAQGVALAARMVGAPAVIVMPRDAPAMKIANTRDYGAEVILYDRYTDNREAITEGVATERGMTIVWPFDDLDVIAGQGTIGLELEAQARGLGARLDLALTPVGGGGLAAGVSTAIRRLSPSTEVYGVEPAAFDDTARSFATGERQSIDPAARSICDALLSPAPGRLTLPLNRANLSGVLTVTDAEVAEAMRFAFTWLKLVVEPGGIVGLAALLAGKVRLEGRTAGVVLSGGNVDPELFSRILAGDI